MQAPPCKCNIAVVQISAVQISVCHQRKATMHVPRPHSAPVPPPPSSQTWKSLHRPDSHCSTACLSAMWLHCQRSPASSLSSLVRPGPNSWPPGPSRVKGRQGAARLVRPTSQRLLDSRERSCTDVSGPGRLRLLMRPYLGGVTVGGACTTKLIGLWQ